MQINVKTGSSQSSDVLPGEPLPIIFINENIESSGKRVKISMKNLRRVLLDPRVANNRVMIVSINGPQKTGKSIFMNICLRYLQKQRIELFASNQESISGFQWGSLLESSGVTIFIWSEPFIVDLFMQSTVAILLMDCQGSFSNKILMKERFAIHAMLQILSSFQIYNLLSEINENNLQWLALNTGYSNICRNHVNKESDNNSDKTSEKNREKPYQTLCMLIRDWPYPYEFFYGSAGGQQYLNRYISTQYEPLPTQNIALRQFLNAQFSNINCYLMPHPKADKPDVNDIGWTWGELSDDFQEHVLGFVKNIFSPQNLVIKQVFGEDISARELLIFTENFFSAATSIDNPKPHTGFDACAKSHHHLILDECVQYYTDLIKTRHRHCKSAKRLLEFHEKCKMSTLQKFDDSSKFGSSKYSEIFRTKLESQIDEDFIRFYALNPSQPVAITRLLSIIIISVTFLSLLGFACKILYFLNFPWIFQYIEPFIFISATMLVIYCLVTSKRIYNELNINLEMQTVLQDQF